jgi:hypothetical protein
MRRSLLTVVTAVVVTAATLMLTGGIAPVAGVGCTGNKNDASWCTPAR